VVVLNFANRGYDSYQLGFSRSGVWRVRFNSDSGAYDAFFGNCLSYDAVANDPGMHNMPVSAKVGIGPYTAIILSQD